MGTLTLQKTTKVIISDTDVISNMTTSNSMEIPIVDGSFSLTSPSMSTSTVTVNEAGTKNIRGQKIFSDSISEASVSFNTYTELYSEGGTILSTDRALWAMLGSVDTIASILSKSGTTFSSDATTQYIDLTDSDRNVLSEFTVLYKLTDSYYIKLTKCQIQGVSLNFSLDDLVSFGWTIICKNMSIEKYTSSVNYLAAETNVTFLPVKKSSMDVLLKLASNSTQGRMIINTGNTLSLGSDPYSFIKGSNYNYFGINSISYSPDTNNLFIRGASDIYRYDVDGSFGLTYSKHYDLNTIYSTNTLNIPILNNQDYTGTTLLDPLPSGTLQVYLNGGKGAAASVIGSGAIAISYFDIFTNSISTSHIGNYGSGYATDSTSILPSVGFGNITFFTSNQTNTSSNILEVKYLETSSLDLDNYYSTLKQLGVYEFVDRPTFGGSLQTGLPCYYSLSNNRFYTLLQDSTTNSDKYIFSYTSQVNNFTADSIVQELSYTDTNNTDYFFINQNTSICLIAIDNSLILHPINAGNIDSGVTRSYLFDSNKKILIAVCSDEASDILVTTLDSVTGDFAVHHLSYNGTSISYIGEISNSGTIGGYSQFGADALACSRDGTLIFVSDGSRNDYTTERVLLYKKVGSVYQYVDEQLDCGIHISSCGDGALHYSHRNVTGLNYVEELGLLVVSGSAYSGSSSGGLAFISVDVDSTNKPLLPALRGLTEVVDFASGQNGLEATPVIGSSQYDSVNKVLYVTSIGLSRQNHLSKLTFNTDTPTVTEKPGLGITNLDAVYLNKERIGTGIALAHDKLYILKHVGFISSSETSDFINSTIDILDTQYITGNTPGSTYIIDYYTRFTTSGLPSTLYWSYETEPNPNSVADIGSNTITVAGTVASVPTFLQGDSGFSYSIPGDATDELNAGYVPGTTFSGDITISMLLNIRSSDTVDRTIIGYFTSGSEAAALKINSSNEISLFVKRYGAAGGSSSVPIPLNTDLHIVITKDRYDYKVYIDGLLSISHNFTAGDSDPPYIGIKDYYYTGKPCDMLFGDLLVYVGVYTQEQVTALYDSYNGTAGYNKGLFSDPYTTKSLCCTKNFKYVIVGSPTDYDLDTSGKVVVLEYNSVADHYEEFQVIQNPLGTVDETFFGHALEIAEDGKYLWVSAPGTTNSNGTKSGAVYLFTRDDITFQYSYTSVHYYTAIPPNLNITLGFDGNPSSTVVINPNNINTGQDLLDELNSSFIGKGTFAITSGNLLVRSINYGTTSTVTYTQDTDTTIDGILNIDNYVSNTTTAGTGDPISSVNLPLTALSLEIQNNISALIPTSLGRVNKPEFLLTGTRSVTGNFSTYLRVLTTNESGSLVENILFNKESPQILSYIDIYLGGKSESTNLHIRLPNSALSLPTHNIEDVMGVGINFTAEGTTLETADEISLTFKKS